MNRASQHKRTKDQKKKKERKGLLPFDPFEPLNLCPFVLESSVGAEHYLIAIETALLETPPRAITSLWTPGDIPTGNITFI